MIERSLFSLKNWASSRSPIDLRNSIASGGRNSSCRNCLIRPLERDIVKCCGWKPSAITWVRFMRLMDWAFFFDSIGEFHAINHLSQLLIAVESTPSFFGLDGQLEDHCQRRQARTVTLGSALPVTHCGKETLDRIGRSDVAPSVQLDSRRNSARRSRSLARHSHALGYLVE